MEIYCVKDVEQNPLPKSQTKPIYIGTKEAPSARICAKNASESLPHTEFSGGQQVQSLDKVLFFWVFLVATTLKIDFSNIQGQPTPQSRVESGSNANSSKMLWLYFQE